jgi:hypothetical protein
MNEMEALIVIGALALVSAWISRKYLPATHASHSVS